MLTNLAFTLQQRPATPSLLPNVIMIASFIAIFWFLLIRPQRKMQQQHREMLGALKTGDEIMTDGGIIGRVVHLGDDRLTLRTAENTRIVVSRQKVARVLPPEGTETKTSGQS